MKDQLGHTLTAFQMVRYSPDVESAGKDALVEVMRQVKWDVKKIFWCPTCKAWSVHT